ETATRLSSTHSMSRSLACVRTPPTGHKIMKALLSIISGHSARKSPRARPFVCWLLVLGPVQGGSTFRAAAQEDDFSSGNDSKWTRYNPIGVASFAVVNGAYRIRTAPSPDPTTFGPGRAGSLLKGTNYGDYFYLTVDIVNWDDSLHQSGGLLARVGSPGPGTTT